MEVGQLISIRLSGARGYSFVAVCMFHATVTEVTEKAVKLTGDNGQFVWLPKKALVEIEGTESHKLAKWFKPSEMQWRVMDNNSYVSAISNA